MKNLRSYYNDPELGSVFILARSNARHITMRIKSDGIHVTASPFAALSHIREVIEEFRPRLVTKLREKPVHFYDAGFRIETDCLCLYFQEARNESFALSSSPGKEIIYYPAATDFHAEGMQQWLRKVLCEALRRQAQIYLPRRLQYQSQRCGLPFNKVTIRGSQSRWGSCSSQKNISLSYYLMTLPSYLIDGVLIHELCHTVEMNHGPHFWALMDKWTQGRASQLTEEIKRCQTEI